ncbi:Uncharacterised protein [Enterobacter hormaechei]|jgi:hypothetical protein|nr:hypothetical protein MS7884_3358 [Enterobacter hormaechei]CAE7611833.1 hypothetical protein AI2772V1_2783 [Enterobacter cloacae]CAF2582023.1 hypothetical protein AI2866V1_2857 [Enterobacter cloacae]CAH3743855.1 hypothetical protein AI2772V1_2783 [Enterobacter cloacae]CAH5354599.1 hypothetical protein AI2866V1_2857 [Enterobacter cloacae]
MRHSLLHMQMPLVRRTLIKNITTIIKGIYEN